MTMRSVEMRVCALGDVPEGIENLLARKAAEVFPDAERSFFTWKEQMHRHGGMPELPDAVLQELRNVYMSGFCAGHCNARKTEILQEARAAMAAAGN